MNKIIAEGSIYELKIMPILDRPAYIQIIQGKDITVIHLDDLPEIIKELQKYQ